MFGIWSGPTESRPFSILSGGIGRMGGAFGSVGWRISAGFPQCLFVTRY